MREISQTAALGKSTMYDYFSSRDEILSFFVVGEVCLIRYMATGVNARNNSPGECLESTGISSDFKLFK